MKLRNYVIVLTTLIALTVIVFSGCSRNSETSQYFDSAKQFNKIYFETVENVDLGNTMESLEQLGSDENKDNIEKLGILVEEIKKSIPKEREKLYDNFKQRYEDLVFLNESYPKFSSLSIDDRGRIDRIFISIGMHKANWKDKKSTVVWE